MPNFTAGTSFTDGVTNDVTAAKLNALVADAVPTSSLSLNSTTGTISQFSSGTGTAASPAIQPTGDTNTGIFFPAADTIAFSEGGTESMRIDSSGRVGIGSTSPQDKLDLGNPSGGLGITWGGSNGASRYNSIFSSYSAAGLVFSSGFHGSASADSYISSFTGTQALAGIRCDSFGATAGNIKFFTDATASRTAGAAVTPTERLRIDSSGNVGIGTTSPSQKLDIQSASASVQIKSTTATNSAILKIENNSTAYIGNESSTTNSLFLGTTAYATCLGNTGAYPVQLATNNNVRMTIDSSGNVSIGTATALSKLHIHGDLTLSNATTAVTASTSTITPPATVAGYLTVSINGTSRKIAYYAT